MLGAVRAAQLLRPDVCVALDTSPVAHDNSLQLDARPVIWYRERVYHTKSECDRLLRIAKEINLPTQTCTYTAAASDAGRIREVGLAGRTICFGFARDNSHGFEIAHAHSIANVTKLLIAYLRQID
jgi:putative aminopeptidase FrvX